MITRIWLPWRSWTEGAAAGTGLGLGFYVRFLLPIFCHVLPLALKNIMQDASVKWSQWRMRSRHQARHQTTSNFPSDGKNRIGAWSPAAWAVVWVLLARAAVASGSLSHAVRQAFAWLLLSARWSPAIDWLYLWLGAGYRLWRTPAPYQPRRLALHSSSQKS